MNNKYEMPKGCDLPLSQRILRTLSLFFILLDRVSLDINSTKLNLHTIYNDNKIGIISMTN